MSWFDDLAGIAGSVGNIGSGLGALGAVGSLFGSSGLSSRKAMAIQAQYNREVMQNQLQWRASDAKAAGIHPLYAMGAPTVSFAPNAVGDTNSLSQRLSDAGQSISRASQAFSDTRARKVIADQQARLNEAQIEGQVLANQKTASEIALMRTGATTPLNSNPLITGQGDSDVGRVNVLPSSVVTGSRSAAARQPGAITEYQFTAPDARGNVGLVPSQDMKQRIEDDFIAETLWHLKNRLIAPRHPDQDMYWNPLTQSYRRNPIPRKYRFIKSF